MGYIADQRSLLITAITLLVAAEVSIALRFWVRYRLNASFQADDWCALAAGIVFLCNNVAMCWGISQNYLGINPLTMDPAHLEVSMKFVFAGVFLMSTILTFCRFSVLFLYNRLFGVYTTFRKILIIYGVVSLMWPLTIWFGTTFRCSPIKASWNLFIPSKCAFSIEDLFIGTEPINAVLDILLVLLPITKIKILQLPLRDRIGLSFVFLLGGFVGLTSVLRIVFTYNPSKLGAVVDSTFWLQLQLGTAIVCCCLPTLRTIMPSKHMLLPVSSSIRRLLGSRATKTSSSGSRTKTEMSVQTIGSSNSKPRNKNAYIDITTTSGKSDDEIALTDVSGMLRNSHHDSHHDSHV